VRAAIKLAAGDTSQIKAAQIIHTEKSTALAAASETASNV
jgi:hypothetical protein